MHFCATSRALVAIRNRAAATITTTTSLLVCANTQHSMRTQGASAVANAAAVTWRGLSSEVRSAAAAREHRMLGDAARMWVRPVPRRAMSEGSPGATGVDLRKAERISLGAGLAAGLFGSVVGVGGGVVIVPMIANACRSLPQRLISGTSLVAVVSTGVFSSINYAGASCVDLGAAACICATAVIMAPLGAHATSVLNCQALRRILGYFLLAVAPLVPLKTFITQQRLKGVAVEADAFEQPHRSVGDFEWPSNTRAALLLSVGGVAGFLSGLLGIGGGVVVTPLLALTSGMEQAECVGTSLCAMIPPALVGVIQHHSLGNINWRMAAALALGTAIGGTAGSKLALQAPEGTLEFTFAGAMLFLGLKMLKR